MKKLIPDHDILKMFGITQTYDEKLGIPVIFAPANIMKAYTDNVINKNKAECVQ